MKILIVDSTVEPNSWGAREILRYSSLAPGAEFIVRRAPEMDLPKLEGFDRIILTGSLTSAFDSSEWVEKLLLFLKEAMDRSLPILGICYGHQILARMLGGEGCLGKLSQPEYGWTEIHLTTFSSLFKGLPEIFYSFSSHVEEVSQLPPKARLLARSELCAVQAFEHEEKPIFGVQFHPEKNLDDAQEVFQSLKKKKKESWFQHAKDGKKIYQPEVAQVIFENFLKL